MKRARRIVRPPASMAVALTALVVALGGTATAALVVTGGNVRDGSLTGRDVKDASLGSSDVIDESLRGRDVKDGTIGATDVDQGALTSIPRAGGVTPRRFAARLALSAGEQKVLDLAGLQLYASCSAAGVPTIRATTAVADSNLQAGIVRGNGQSAAATDSSFDPGESRVVSSGGRGSASIAYMQPAGAGTSVLLGFDGGTNTAVLNGCVVSGTAFGG